MHHTLHEPARVEPLQLRRTGLDCDLRKAGSAPGATLPDRPIHAWGGPTHAPLCPETLGDTVHAVKNVTCLRCLSLLPVEGEILGSITVVDGKIVRAPRVK